MAEQMTNEERRGVEMIRALKEYMGEEEPEHIYLHQWRTANESVKRQVRKTYQRMMESNGDTQNQEG